MKGQTLFTELKQGNLILVVRRFEFVIFLSDNIIKRIKASKYTLQYATAFYDDILKKEKALGNIIGETIKHGNGYISWGVDSDSKDKIESTFNKLGFYDILNKNDFHFTLFYDKRNIYIEPEEAERDFEIKATALNVNVIGENNQAIAVIFESKGLRERFEYLKSIGFIHDFDNLIIHCTFKYNPSQEYINLVLEKEDCIVRNIGEIILKKEEWKKAVVKK